MRTPAGSLARAARRTTARSVRPCLGAESHAGPAPGAEGRPLPAPAPARRASGPLRARRGAAVLTAALLATGCVGDRVLRIDTIPSGADVRLDDHLVGITPLELPFEHYGHRRLGLYKPGYRTYSEPLVLDAPWWARFPLDIVTEVLLPLGLDDVRTITIDLVADTGSEAAEATAEFLEHAQEARGGADLEGEPIAGREPEPDGDA